MMQRRRANGRLNEFFSAIVLGAGIDHPTADLRILRPERHQPPVERVEPTHAAVLEDRVDALGSVQRCSWRSRGVGQQLLRRIGTEVLRQLIRRRRRGEPTAHQDRRGRSPVIVHVPIRSAAQVKRQLVAHFAPEARDGDGVVRPTPRWCREATAPRRQRRRLSAGP